MGSARRLKGILPTVIVTNYRPKTLPHTAICVITRRDLYHCDFDFLLVTDRRLSTDYLVLDDLCSAPAMPEERAIVLALELVGSSLCFDLEVPMLTRFAAATVVASIAVAIAAVIVLMLPGVTLQQASPLLGMWCIAPCVWGLWAMLAPRSWIPRRLPLLGVILGIVAGLLAAFVLNMPHRVFGVSVSGGLRAVGALLIACFYYLLWMAVSFTYRKFASSMAS
jgi:uncharacterized membrane protein HdeD (DUF308 family)